MTRTRWPGWSSPGPGEIPQAAAIGPSRSRRRQGIVGRSVEPKDDGGGTGCTPGPAPVAERWFAGSLPTSGTLKGLADDFVKALRGW